MVEPAEGISRGAFLKQATQETGRWLARYFDELRTLGQPNEPKSVDKIGLRPPGAISEVSFVTTCDPYCSDCRDVCPRQAIEKDADGFPIIQPEHAPCVMCDTVPCTQVCPTEALVPLNDPKLIRIGTAVLDTVVCTAYRGSGCQVCVDVCPVGSEAIQLVEGLPQIVEAGCTGCGVCVHHCPTEQAVVIVPHAVAFGVEYPSYAGSR